MPDENFIDAKENITGLSGIINSKKTRKGVNLASVEQNMLKTFKNPKDASDAVDDFKREMKKITDASGIDMDETWDTDALMGPSKAEDELPDIDDDSIFGEEFMQKNDPLKKPFNNKFQNEVMSFPTEKKVSPKVQMVGFKNQPSQMFSVKKTSATAVKSDDDDDDSFWNLGSTKPTTQVSRPQQSSTRSEDVFDEQPKQRFTQEQIRQRNVNKFMSKIDESLDDSNDDIFEQVKQNDEKQYILNQIDTLRGILEEDDVDISHIPVVDIKSDMKTIKDAHKLLIIKNDTKRCSSMAEEGILMLAYGLEDIFDGKRVFFGKFRPNLTGWHTTAQNKLRRMRYETSNVVSGLMQSYGIGNIGRIVLELGPSMVIYSKRKQSSSSEPDLVDTDAFGAAMRDIQNK